MAFPLKPHYLPLQRYAHRFWNTDDMMEILSVHHGSLRSTYPQTWAWRTLITVHRDQNTQNAYRKGYGPDWKAEIKRDLRDYAKDGKLPLNALKLGAEWLREVERTNWIARQARGPEQTMLHAAE